MHSYVTNKIPKETNQYASHFSYGQIVGCEEIAGRWFIFMEGSTGTEPPPN
jgi:hypothetical protein